MNNSSKKSLDFRLNSRFNQSLKGIVLLFFAHPHAVPNPNPYDLLFYIKKVNEDTGCQAPKSIINVVYNNLCTIFMSSKAMQNLCVRNRPKLIIYRKSCYIYSAFSLNDNSR